jgi:hypothetical protein
VFPPPAPPPLLVAVAAPVAFPFLRDAALNRKLAPFFFPVPGNVFPPPASVFFCFFENHLFFFSSASSKTTCGSLGSLLVFFNGPSAVHLFAGRPIDAICLFAFERAFVDCPIILLYRRWLVPLYGLFRTRVGLAIDAEEGLLFCSLF